MTVRRSLTPTDYGRIRIFQVDITKLVDRVLITVGMIIGLTNMVVMSLFLSWISRTAKVVGLTI